MGFAERWVSALALCLRTARWRWIWAESHTLSLSRNQWSTAGTSDRSSVQGNNGGWYPRTHWNGVSPVVSGAANSGHTLPRVDTGSSCPDVHDSRPGDTARFLGSFVRSGHWFVDGTRRINSLILPGGGGTLARPRDELGPPVGDYVFWETEVPEYVLKEGFSCFLGLTAIHVVELICRIWRIGQRPLGWW